MESTTLDNFFNDTSLEAARNIIGRGIEVKKTGEIFTVTDTKPYKGDSRQTSKKQRYERGRIMMFNLRGHLHFCVSTGRDSTQDYFLIEQLKESDGQPLYRASMVSQALRLTMEQDGLYFSDLFNLNGQRSKKSEFKPRQNEEAPTCLGTYLLAKE